MWRRLWCYRTRVAGYLGVVLGVMELRPDVVGEWVAAPRRGTLLLILGMITAAIGHFNASSRPDDDDKP